jgi:hypothetical protein|tara:strand:- start:1205 stop:2692 length:1488 start_codon:yes stop_codon:yes gene_type:complete
MAIKFLNNLDVQGTIDLNDNQLLNVVVQKLATDPAVVEGQIYYNTGSDILKYATASAWVSLSSATGDMTAVNTGTGLTGGGTSGAVTIALSSATIAEIDANTAKNSFSSANATKLSNIATSANNYSLPTASSSTLGGVKVGTNLSINASGVLSSTDTNTTYSVGDGGLTQKNFTTTLKSKLDGIGEGATITNTTNVVAALTAGTNVTIAANGTIAATDTNTTYSVGNGGLTEINFTSADNTKLDGITASANNYTHPSSHAISFITGLQTALNAKAAIAGQTLTGAPKAPTADAGTNTTQLATTAFVKTAITNLVGGAPAALDTLNELAAAIGDDASYASGITTALAAKSATAGNTSLTTVGIIATGEWRGTAINATYLSGQSGTNTGDEPDASLTVKGIVELATTTEAKTSSSASLAVTPAGIQARRYSTTVGGSVSATVTHNLGSRAVMVQMYDTSSFETVYADVVRTSTSAVTIGFASAPASGDVTVLVSLIG